MPPRGTLYRFEIDGRRAHVVIPGGPYSPQEVEDAVRTQLAMPKKTGSSFKLLEGEGEAAPAAESEGATPFQRLSSRIQAAIRSIPSMEGTPSLQIPPSANVPQPGIKGVGQEILAGLVPADEIELGAQLFLPPGAKVAAKLGLKGAKAAALRIASVMSGAYAGAALMPGMEPEEAAKRAATLGLTVAAAEGVMGVLSYFRRIRPGARGQIKEQRAAEMGEAVGELNPSLGTSGPRSAQDLAMIAKDYDVGKAILGDNFEANLMAAEQALSVAAKKTRPPVPATYPAGPTSATHRAGALDWEKIKVPALSDKPLTLREASELLKVPSQRGFGAGENWDPMKRAVNAGKNAREITTEALGQIKSEVMRIDPTAEAWTWFDAMREDYSVGMALLRALRARGVFEPTREGVLFRRDAVQREVRENWGYYTEHMPQQDIEKFTQEALGWTPETWGAQDKVGPGRGTIGQPAREIIRGAGGSTQIVGAPLRATVAAAADEIVGAEAPLLIGQTPRTIADFLALVGTSPWTRSRRGD